MSSFSLLRRQSPRMILLGIETSLEPDRILSAPLGKNNPNSQEEITPVTFRTSLLVLFSKNTIIGMLEINLSLFRSKLMSSLSFSRKNSLNLESLQMML